MKKNQNILNYVDKYKEKYGIKYADNGSPLINGLGVAAIIVWCYSLLILITSVFSFILKFKSGIFAYTDFKSVFITTVACSVLMIISAVFYVINKKVIASVVAIITQLASVLTYMPISVYADGYMASFYWKFVIPAALIILIAVAISFILIRAAIKTNKIYNSLVDGIYNQYGSKDGQKLSEKQWQEFLNNYNPYK